MSNVTSLFCSGCGTQNLGTKFCESCGQAAPVTTQPPAIAQGTAATPATAVSPAIQTPLGSPLNKLVLALYVLSVAVPTFAIAVSSHLFDNYDYEFWRVWLNVGNVLSLLTGLVAGIAALTSSSTISRRGWGAALGFLYGGLSLLLFLPVFEYSGWISILVTVLLPTTLFLSWGIARPFAGRGFAAIPIGIVLWALVSIALLPLFYSVLLSLRFVGDILELIVTVAIPLGVIFFAILFEKRRNSLTPQTLVHHGNGAYAGGSHPAMTTGTNVMATLSLVFGILSGTILAIVFGHVAKSQIRRTREAGNGMATAGLVLGYFWLAVAVVVIIIYIVIFVTQLNRSYSYYG